MSELNSNCILCLYPCGPENNCNEFRKHLFALTNYVQFSKINEESSEVRKLTICETCQNNLKRFNDLLKALQIAEMKVDSCLKEIHDVMLRKRQKTESEGMRAFQGNLIEKTSSKLRRSRFQPIIKIEKTRISRISTIPVSQIERSIPSEVNVDANIKVEPKQEEVHPNDFEIEYNDNDDDDLNGFDVETNDEQISAEENGEEDEAKIVVQRKFKGKRGGWFKRLYCLHCKVQVKYGERHLQIYHKKTSPNETPEQLKCLYCRAHFTEARITGIKRRRLSASMGGWMLRQHILQYHPEHYFPTHRLGSISLPDFQKIVMELLFQDLIEGRESCAHCPRPFKNPSKHKQKFQNRLRIKLHYVEFHFKNLEEKLKGIQNDPDLQEKLRKCNPEGRLCDLCGIYLTNSASLVGHEKLHCRFTKGPKLFTPLGGAVKKLPVSETEDKHKVKCNLCGCVVTREYAKHHVNNHSKPSFVPRELSKRKKMKKKKRKVLDLESKSKTPCGRDMSIDAAMEIGLD